MSAFEAIMARFPFGEVQAYMQRVGWHWAWIKGVPTVGDLERCVRSLYETCRAGGSAATGGFRVTCAHYDEDYTDVSVEFRGKREEPESWQRVWSERASALPAVAP